MNSGRTQAKKYISGELVFPQALICCNDYMAYGFLDECMEQEIPIPEKTAVIGYEYIRERRNHDPLLTTYQRNRKGLGESAVLLSKISKKTPAS
ncbi:MAG: substrate-binding domain-containing protein [Oscillospiraceae bacterium]